MISSFVLWEEFILEGTGKACIEVPTALPSNSTIN